MLRDGEQKVANEILEQESQLRLQEVATMKKQQLSASREMQKLKEHAGKEEQEWKEQASHTIDELRRENQHLTKLHDLAQVGSPSSPTASLPRLDRPWTCVEAVQ